MGQPAEIHAPANINTVAPVAGQRLIDIGKHISAPEYCHVFFLLDQKEAHVFSRQKAYGNKIGKSIIALTHAEKFIYTRPQDPCLQIFPQVWILAIAAAKGLEIIDTHDFVFAAKRHVVLVHHVDTQACPVGNKRPYLAFGNINFFNKSR